MFDKREAFIKGYFSSVNQIEKHDSSTGYGSGSSTHNARLTAKYIDMFLLIRDLRYAMDMAEIPPVNNDLYKRCEEILKVGKV